MKGLRGCEGSFKRMFFRVSDLTARRSEPLYYTAQTGSVHWPLKGFIIIH